MLFAHCQNLLGGLQSIHLGHTVVHQNDLVEVFIVVYAVLDELNSFKATGARFIFDVVHAQHGFKHKNIHQFVIHDQNLGIIIRLENYCT